MGEGKGEGVGVATKNERRGPFHENFWAPRRSVLLLKMRREEPLKGQGQSMDNQLGSKFSESLFYHKIETRYEKIN